MLQSSMLLLVNLICSESQSVTQVTDSLGLPQQLPTLQNVNKKLCR